MIPRRPLALALCALSAAACNCGAGKKLHQAGPSLGVKEPSTPGLDGSYLIDFGRVAVGESASREAVLVNEGDADLTLDRVDIDPLTAASFQIEVGALPAKLAPLATWRVAVTFFPREPGAAAGAFTVHGDDSRKPTATFRLRAQGVQDGVLVCERTAQGDRCNDSVKPPERLTVDFGLVPLGSPATAKLVVKNAGSKEALVSAASLSGDPAFTAGPAFAPRTLAPGEEVVVDATLTPNDGRPVTSTYTVSSDDPKRPTIAVDLKGGGKAPALCPANGDTLDFGIVPVGQQKTATFQFASCGTEALTIDDLPITPAAFDLPTPPQKPWTLPPGQTASLDVRYAPVAPGGDQGTVTLQGNAPFTVKLVGHGTGCALTFVPPRLSFGGTAQGSTQTGQAALVNTGDQSCHVTAVTKPGSAHFSLPAVPALPFDVAPNAVVTVFVDFHPAAGGPLTDSLSVTAGAQAAQLDLWGLGLGSDLCAVAITPASLSFGAVPEGTPSTLTVTAWNYGTMDCTLFAAFMQSGATPGFKPKVAIPSFIHSGGSVAIPLEWTPVSAGNASGTLDVQWGIGSIAPKINDTLVPVTGTATGAQVCVTPTSLDFGTVTVGGTATRQVTITSCGSGTFVLQGLSLVPGSSRDFSFAPLPGPQVLSPGQSYTATLTFKPKTTTGQSGQLEIVSSGTPPDIRVPLLGNMAAGCDKVLSCAPTAIQFPTTDVGVTSTLAVTCASVGAQPVTIQSITLNAPPELTLSGVKTGTLAPGQTFAMIARFTPKAPGGAGGTLDVVSDDCRGNASLPVSGIGKQSVPPSCTQPRTFSPVEKWSWSVSGILPDENEIWTTPLVLNLTDDNGDGFVNTDDTPDVVVLTTECLKYRGRCGDLFTNPGRLRLLDGRTGAEHWVVQDQNLRVNSLTAPAVGDLDLDGVPEILVTRFFIIPPPTSTGNQGRFVSGNILAFNADGSFRWMSDPWVRPFSDFDDGGAIVLADLDGDGFPEIIAGATVWDRNGKLLWNDATHGTASVGHGPHGVAADLDGDGFMEVVAGNTVYRHDGTIFWRNANVPDGASAVVDLDGDGRPEVLVQSGWDDIVVLDSRNGTVLRHVGSQTHANAIPSPFAVGDLDGSGHLQIATAVSNQLQVWSGSGQLVWSAAIGDNSGASGIALFDFEGDGHVDVVYGDERNIYVFDGVTGAQKYQAPRDSATGFDTPVIADVDNDGHADLLVVSDGIWGFGVPGIKAMSNTGNDWVSAPRVWSSHDYRVTNIDEAGVVPQHEQTQWKGIRWQKSRCK